MGNTNRKVSQEVRWVDGLGIVTRLEESVLIYKEFQDWSKNGAGSYSATMGSMMGAYGGTGRCNAGAVWRPTRTTFRGGLRPQSRGGDHLKQKGVLAFEGGEFDQENSGRTLFVLMSGRR